MNISDLSTNTHVPYSEQPSFAVVESKEGRFYPGCRVENISYPLSISAAQSGLFCCISEGDIPHTVWTSHTDDTMIPFWENEFGIAVEELDHNDTAEFEFPDLQLNADINVEETLAVLLDDAQVEHSNFPVSALVETENGFFSGVNIECSSWNMGLCAERVAIAKALAFGAEQLNTLHIHTRDGEFSSPCGACRQVIIEHLPDRKVHLHHADHSKSIHFSNDLLPHSFRSSSLTTR